MAKDRPLLETATQFPKKRTYYKILALQICCNWKMKLIRPEEFHLTSYVAALNRAIDLGTTNTERAQRKLSEIAADPESFLAKQEDPEALSSELKLSDGNYVPRIPSKMRFLWDGELCGTISFSWQVGTTQLPPYYLGHIGYEVFSWKRGKGYATESLRQILSEPLELGMPFVELVTNPENLSSQRVITKNGGVLHERFVQPELHGGKDGLRYRIYL